MKPRKHGNKWEIQYRVSGYSKPFKERYSSREEAQLRCAEIELNKKRGTLAPPEKNQKAHTPTVSELLDEYVSIYGRKKEQLHGLYQDFDMVIAQPDGRPTEERLLAKSFKALIEKHDLPVVVFHSLRHLSTSLKLQYSEGDIKAVQGDTGHAQASMVTQVYSHTFDENRRRVANRMETSFFSPAPKTEQKRDEKSEQIITLLTKSPELADLLLDFADRLTGAQAS